MDEAECELTQRIEVQWNVHALLDTLVQNSIVPAVVIPDTDVRLNRQGVKPDSYAPSIVAPEGIFQSTDTS